ncbi:MAG: hypothetical protein IPL65_13915 [Lewinellaceae bacterium]|nr:hypothetical protein [Lewinellaceae bacterium]
MRPYILLLAVLCFSLPVYSQTLRAYEKAADKAFAQKDYSAAAEHYAHILAKKVIGGLFCTSMRTVPA